MAFVVVSHQRPEGPSLLPGLLQRCARMPVAEITDGMRVQEDRIYVPPPGWQVTIAGGVLRLREPGRHERAPLPIDAFFRSLAEDQQENAVGVVLSGTGTDGTLGLVAIQGHAGLTMAQEIESARYASMPTSAIATGLVDYVLPADRLPARLLAWAQSMTGAPRMTAESRGALERILELLRDRGGNDFSAYKLTPICRRIERRLRIHQFGSLAEYLSCLQSNPHEAQILSEELLVGMTSFFRDPEAFRTLATKGLSRLLSRRPEGARVRAWVIGCATGEEAYSLAMLLREHMERTKTRLNVQIFASDLDRHAIESARGGFYPAGITSDVSATRLARFFTRQEGGYRVKRALRDMVTFAVHNVLTDPPFTKLDLILCRNLLIYLEPHAQHQVLPLCHYALNPGGLLLLGASDTTERGREFFVPLDSRWKLYRRAAVSAMPVRRPSAGARRSADQASGPFAIRPSSFRDLVNGILLERYAPASLLVDRSGGIVFAHGWTPLRTEATPGQPAVNVADLTRTTFRAELHRALQRAARSRAEVVSRSLPVKSDRGIQLVRLLLRRLTKPEALRGLFLVTFEPETTAPIASAARRFRAPTKGTERGRSDDTLVQQLALAKERHERAVEDLQIRNEELQSTIEELEVVNEKLERTTAELERTKEESQSTAEELSTINIELKAKLDELAAAHDDLQNVLDSTQIATLFVDTQLNVRRFTPEAKRLMAFSSSDIGSPLAEVAAGLVEDAREVLQTAVPREREIGMTSGQWYAVRVLPYRTLKGTIGGVIVTIVDVTKAREARSVLRDARRYVSAIVETAAHPLIVLDHQLRVIHVNDPFCRTFGVTRLAVEGELVYRIGAGAWDVPELRELLDVTLPREGAAGGIRLTLAGRTVMSLGARRVAPRPDQPPIFVLAMTVAPPEGSAGREVAP
jgi:two-component system, chemotaxis family, CheB/CheR fusion protein